MTEEQFRALVDNVVTTYDKARDLSQREMKEFRKEMVENWEDLVASGVAKVMSAEEIAKADAKKAAKTGKKVAKQTKKTAKKTAKKATKTAKKTVNKAAKKVAKKTG